ncbi:MAG: hypothetical protein J3K34DRAFT_522054 [Monoraphidium minutum]|nr:MAG: hypothetical protein J3K34DRAFT_522054 [Monoraphidium minutum]
MAQKAAPPPSAAWKNVYDEFTHKHWRGYAGNWFLFAKGRPEPMRLKALRTFRFHDEGRLSLTHRNVYSAPGVLSPVRREADGLWEQSWERSSEDPSYGTNFELSPDEAAHPDARPVRRLVSITPDAYIGAPPRQPGAGWAPAQWAIELFLRGGDGTRWSFGAVYPAGGPPTAAAGAAPPGGAAAPPGGAAPPPGAAAAPPYRLSMHFLIQERWAGEVPESPIDLEALPFIEPRAGTLPERPSEWLSGGPPLSVSRRAARVEGDALSAISAAAAGGWAPPEVPPGHELLLLPDLMYAVVPSQLPFGDAAAAGGGGGAGDLVFEFGGRMRGGAGMRRVRAEYAAGGRAAAFAFDVAEAAA